MTPQCGSQGDPPAGDVEKAWKNGLVFNGVFFTFLTGVVIWAYLAGETMIVAGETIGAAALFGRNAMFIGVLLEVWAISKFQDVVGGYYRSRCDDREGDSACWAGVVDDVQKSFSGAGSVFFPFTAQHGYVDIVVKDDYWPLVTDGAYFINCARPGEPPAYVLRTYFYNEQVCTVGRVLNSDAYQAFSGLIAFAAGALAGAATAGAVAVAAGCATVFLCPLAIAAFIVVAIIVAIITLIAAAMAAGNAARAASDDEDPLERGDPADPPSGEDSARSDGGWLQAGDLVTVRGNVVMHPDLKGAKVGWFGDPGTVLLHGRADGDSPFSHVDAEQLDPDGCQTETRVFR